MIKKQAVDWVRKKINRDAVKIKRRLGAVFLLFAALVWLNPQAGAAAEPQVGAAAAI